MADQYIDKINFLNSWPSTGAWFLDNYPFIISDINALRLPLSEDELADLIDQLTSALNDINLVDTGLCLILEVR